MVYSTNMNLDVLQCKNCWKQGHTAGVCHIQRAKCVKCNGPHQTVHHQYYTWCCKANEKTNSPKLEIKKGNLCPHTFKCLNCKGNHQASLNECPFWKHRFNKEWHSKEYTNIWDNQKNLTHSAVNGNTILLQQPLTRMALIVCLLQQSSQSAIQQWGLQENSTRSSYYIASLFI